MLTTELDLKRGGGGGGKEICRKEDEGVRSPASLAFARIFLPQFR